MHVSTSTSASASTSAATSTLFAVVEDEFGNRTFFPVGEVPEKVNGVPVDIISSPVTWDEAHNWL